MERNVKNCQAAVRTGQTKKKLPKYKTNISYKKNTNKVHHKK
jgi:hypothetical protein